ncbi:tyrosine-type recombinase/integrase [Nitrosomonas communis]|uniref:tyrosine-type recombinase/integrase n=1 Tax=Nitrosomonas communis TaxID=44574 RepID=UPI003D2BE563
MFRTKAEANMWIAETEKAILQGKYGKQQPESNHTFNDLMQRYAKQVSPTKRGAEWEIKRINMLSRYGISSIPLEQLNQTHFAEWRDLRLGEVTPATVLREWNLISNALNIAVNEWKWLPENPLKGVRKPKQPPARTRRISQDEIDRLLYALGYSYSEKPETVTSRVGASMLFAIETAMRAGEIASLAWDNLDFEKRVAKLPMTKNGFPREVPLSAEAIRIIEQVKSVTESVNTVFNLNTAQIDALFRKAKKRAMIDDLHYHDSRAEAITRLAKKVDILTLARISGHRDMRQLQIYYRESVEDIAKRI